MTMEEGKKGRGGGGDDIKKPRATSSFNPCLCFGAKFHLGVGETGERMMPRNRPENAERTAPFLFSLFKDLNYGKRSKQRTTSRLRRRRRRLKAV